MIKKSQKLYCANNLTGMVVSRLMAMHPDDSQYEIMSKFSQTETYRQLYDFSTALWKEGPDYLLFLLSNEDDNGLTDKRSG